MYTTACDEKVVASTSCVPPQLVGRLNKYVAVYAKEQRNFVDRETGVQLTFDFNRNYSEALLIHEQCGGGTLSHDLLERVTLSEQILGTLLNRLKLLEEHYVAIHVRNTDYKTDYETLFSSVKQRVQGKAVLVCSDDAEVIREARDYFSHSRILTCSAISDTKQRPLHSSHTILDEGQRKKVGIDSMVDLFALGLSEELHFSDVSAGYPSGFSRLASFLHGDIRVVLRLLRAVRHDLAANGTEGPSATESKLRLALQGSWQ